MHERRSRSSGMREWEECTNAAARSSGMIPAEMISACMGKKIAPCRGAANKGLAWWGLDWGGDWRGWVRPSNAFAGLGD